MTSILIFAGSTKATSVNRKLAACATTSARKALKGAPGATVTHIELAEFDIPMYNADLEVKGTPPDVLKLKSILYAHDGWIVCSPEYNGGTTALLKNTIDWCSSPAVAGTLHGADVVRDWGDGGKPFKGKVVGLMAASPGAMGGLRSLGSLNALMLNLHAWVAPEQFALGRAGQAFDADGELVEAHNAARVDAVVAQVIWAAERLGG